ncbi:hypothetical protein [Streptomyces sp. NPDC088350]|uniref:hypothetical protein n=1 Tax=Streptomyces sp. NPDC088350 TaxID=3365854 RepID=UPI00382E4C9C
MREVVVNGLIAGPLGIVIGFCLSYFQQRRSDKKAERARLLALMQQLVVEVMDLERARRIYREAHLSRRAKFRTLSVAGVEFWSAWSARGRNWEAASAALAPAMRIVDAWDRRTLTEGVEMTAHMARVSAVGLPLGMVEDKAIAGAAQRLMDAALEDKGDEEITAAVRELRAAFYGKAD